jgi:hypothetical protein
VKILMWFVGGRPGPRGGQVGFPEANFVPSPDLGTTGLVYDWSTFYTAPCISHNVKRLYVIFKGIFQQVSVASLYIHFADMHTQVF